MDEIAKKLKAAGFPQDGENYDDHGNQLGDYENGYIPTLKELIKACGERFYELAYLGRDNKDIEVWQGKDLQQKDGLWQMYRGSTPEEAVAKLWLALKNKPTH